MSEILKFSCGTTIENISCRPGIGGLLVELEIRETELDIGGLICIDQDGYHHEPTIVKITMEQQSLRPLIQWLILLESELK